MRWVQGFWASLCVLLTWLFAPLELVLTGEHALLTMNTFAPIISNHQIYTGTKN